jgi:hypothetical protein
MPLVAGFFTTLVCTVLRFRFAISEVLMYPLNTLYDTKSPLLL